MCSSTTIHCMSVWGQHIVESMGLVVTWGGPLRAVDSSSIVDLGRRRLVLMRTRIVMQSSQMAESVLLGIENMSDIKGSCETRE